VKQRVALISKAAGSASLLEGVGGGRMLAWGEGEGEERVTEGEGV
jgi:hypothetical protein